MQTIAKSLHVCSKSRAKNIFSKVIWKSHHACRALGDQEHGGRGERGQGLILSFGESVQNKNCPILDAV